MMLSKELLLRFLIQNLNIVLSLFLSELIYFIIKSNNGSLIIFQVINIIKIEKKNH